MKRTTSITKQIEEREFVENKNKQIFLPTGSTQLNLAMTDKVNGGYHLGKMVNLIGDSSSGKTFLAFTAFAEANRLKYFANHRFIKDDPEAADEFDIPKLFGQKTADRIEAPMQDKDGNDVHSSTIEDFLYHVKKALQDERPFIYVLDSLDALTSEADEKKIEAEMKAHEKGTKTAGSYGMEKAKLIGRILRTIVRELKKTNSILIIISQTRDNIDPMVMTKKTRSGGKALKFFATHEIWLANAGKVNKNVKGTNFKLGNNVLAKVTKNKITGKHRQAQFVIYYDYGVDDIASCIDFMVDNNFWTKKKLTISIPELELEGTREKLIRSIEEKGLARKVSKLVEEAWLEMEEKVKLNRKAKYA